MESQVLLVDAGTGNLHSVHNALRFLGINVQIVRRPEELRAGCRVVLPGVGAFGKFMQGLKDQELTAALAEVARRGDPLLGICVGMQALFDVGEEMGSFPGLGFIPGRVIHFPDLGELKVPHTGWNQLWFPRTSPLFAGLPDGCYAYFNHSYYCQPAQENAAIACTDYGFPYASAVQVDNLYGVQFHPEKSQAVGQALLKNFVTL